MRQAPERSNFEADFRPARETFALILGKMSGDRARTQLSAGSELHCLLAKTVVEAREKEMMSNRCVLGLVLVFAGLFGADPSQAAESVKPAALGSKVGNSESLRDLRGTRRGLQDFKGHPAVVLAFLGTECPVGNLYLARLIELEKQLRSKKVQFLAVYSNEHDDLDAIATHTHDRDVPFLALKDFGQKLADSLGVTRVPTVVVLDGEFSLRYRGRIDDRYGVASRREKATREDLVQAVEEVLAGKQVSVAETEADGCLLDRGGKVSAKTDVTYSKHVAGILQKHCQECHRPDQTAPFALMNFEDAVKHGRMIREVTSQRRMPPWHADARFGHFSNDRRMSPDEIEALATWVDGGMIRGDDKDLPKPIAWPKGWVHGTPDLVLTMLDEFEVPAEGVLPYKNWIIETNFTEDKWVRIAECRPGSPNVVHHVVAYIMKEGQRGPIGQDGTLPVLVGWAPGDLGLVCPPDTAMRVPKGAKLRLEMHYTPIGKVTKDRSSVGITFASQPPKFELFLNEFANMSFEIPPQHPHYKAEATLRFRADARLVSLSPHMHWRGKDYSYEVIYPDGKRETLLSVPRWDFNWQNSYRFQEPVKIPKGSKLHSVAHWDNSANNPLNPDPNKSARFGLQTWEEMMVGFVAFVWERPETAQEIAKNPPLPADLMFDRLDLNGDDFITVDEIPDRFRPFIMVSGVKLPEKISREEFHKIFDEMRKRMPQRNPNPGGADNKKPDAKPDAIKPKPEEPEKRKQPVVEESSQVQAVPETEATVIKTGGAFEVETVKDIAYVEGPDADSKKHKLDLFLPKGHKDYPVLFFIHGGAWASGDRKLYGSLGNVFAKNGVGAVLISYRLTPQVQHPGHIEDVARAFAWTHKNIAKYGGRPDQIFVTGHSAGGHLAALLATNEQYLKAEKLSLKDIKGAMPMSGIYIFLEGRMEKVIGKGPEAAASASPIKHVTSEAPPFLIPYADKDFAGCATMSKDFCAALEKKKVEAACLEVKDRNHITVIVRAGSSEADPLTQALLEFIAKHSTLKLTAKETKSEK